MISYLQATVKFFSNSNIAVAELQKARNDVDITTGLVKVGKTRFATHWAAASALNRCLPLIRNLVEEKKIKLVRIQIFRSLTAMINDASSCRKKRISKNSLHLRRVIFAFSCS
jgi:hypothetical protein